ncbi:MAG: hypothetical protein ACK5PP_17500 [Acidimicrobiales bacterium]
MSRDRSKPMVKLADHEVVAHNTATASENRIHDDDVASSFGFRGGLVPGVDVFAYLCRPAIAHWGTDLPDRGRMECRFDRPVFDGETVTVTGRTVGRDRLQTAVDTEDGRCASLEAELLVDPAPPMRFPPRADLPGTRPPAGPETLAGGTVLGTLEAVCDPDDHADYLHQVRDEDSALAVDGPVHPGWLLRLANRALASSVMLGPWIHVGSTMTNYRSTALGEPLTVRSRVERSFEHKGHRFVLLDVLVLGADATPRSSMAHTALYEPRQVRTSA